MNFVLPDTRRAGVCGILLYLTILLLAAVVAPSLALAQAGAPRAQATVTPRQVTVVAGQPSQPVALNVTTIEPVRATQQWIFSVQLPPVLEGWVEVQPPRITVGIPTGQRQGTTSFRFVTRPDAPAGTHTVRLTAGPDGPATQLALVISPARTPVPERDPTPAPTPTPIPRPDPAPVPAPRTGNVQLLLEPAALQLCQGDGNPVSGSLRIRAGGGYRGTPMLGWTVPPGLSISPQAVPPLALPPDREVPFQLSAPAAQAGMHEIRVSAVDPSSGLRSEARAQVNVVPASFSARLTPASVTLRAGGAAVSIGVSTDAVQCLGDQPVSMALGALPPGISASPPSGVMQRPGDPALIRLQALPDAPPGRHTVAVNLVHSGRFGQVRREVQLPVTVEPAPGVVVAAPVAPGQIVQPAPPATPAVDPPDQEPDAPVPSGPVERLNIGGFTVLVTRTDAPEPDAFSGEGVLEDLVFAGRLQTVTVTVGFQGLSLQPTATPGTFDVVSGEAVFDKAVILSLPQAVAGMTIQLTGMRLGPGGASIDGQVFLPFTDHSTPIETIVFGSGAGGAGGNGTNGGSQPEGFSLIPAIQLGDVMPFEGGGTILAFQGAPVTDGPWLGAMLVEAGVLPTAALPQGALFTDVPGPPAGRMTFNNQPLSPSGDFTYTGVASLPQHAIAQSGIAFLEQHGVQVVLDLSGSANSHQQELNAAYAAWDVAEPAAQVQIGLNYASPATPPGVPHTSPQWMGLIFVDASLSASGIGMSNRTSHVAWVAAGFQSLLAQSFGSSTETVSAHGWQVDLLNLAVGLRNSVLVDAGALGNVHLPLFDQPIRVLLKMTNGGSPTMSVVGPVARHFGHTAIIGEGGGFFWHQGSLKLGFTDARWAFNADLSAPPQQVAQQPGPNPFQAAGAFTVDGAQTSLETLKGSFQHKFHLKQLTLTATGGADLFGTSQRPLGTVPSLDFLNYPFLSGGAWILVERQGSSYTLGLRGNLELASNLGSVQATTRYTVSNGQESSWTFSGELQASVKVVDLDLAIAGEVDLATRDLFFHGTGGFTVQELFQVQAAGAFGRQGATRYWFVQASLDLQGTPIIDTGVLAFYSFQGGMAHNLKAEVAGTCSILNPASFASNANQCVDSSVDWTFLAGTVLAPSEAYGGARTVHVDGTLMISSQGSVDILGQAWFMRTFNQGYAANATPQAAAHIGINKDRFVMTACVGPSGTSQGAPASAQTISCEGLLPLRYPAQVPVVEVKGWTGMLLDWKTNTYYLAVGHYDNKVQARLFGLAYRSGYLILAYSPSVPSTWLPPMAGGQAGFYVGREAGYSWDFEYSWSGVCQNNKVWAYASLGSESNLFLEVLPFALYADVHYWVNVGLGAQICNIGGGVKLAGNLGGSVYVSQALGQLNGSFGGHILVCGSNKCVRLVRIPNLNVGITLWQA